MSHPVSITPEAPPLPTKHRRSGAAKILIVSLCVLGVSTLGLIVTLTLGLNSLADTGLGFELGYYGATAEEYVWEEQGVDALLTTAVWGLVFGTVMLASSAVATVASIVLIVRAANR